jgi:hypothetical protein
MVQWQNGEILPKITVTNSILPYIEVNFEKSPFSIEVISPIPLPD